MGLTKGQHEKTEKIFILVTPEDKQLILKHANRVGLSMTSFCLSVVLDKIKGEDHEETS